jgi:hypothetical protein
MIVENFRREGTLREKYDVVTRSSDVKVEVGYSANVVGFGWTNGVFQEQQAAGGEGEIDVGEKGIAAQAPVDGAAEENGEEDGEQGAEVEGGDGGGPEAGEGEAGHREDAGGEEVGLERGAEMLWGPLPECPIHDQGRAVHAKGAAENAGDEAAAEKPCPVIVLEVEFLARGEGVEGEGSDQQGEEDFDGVLVYAGEEEEPQRGAQKSGGEESAGAADVDVAPVLEDDDGGDGNRDEHGERSGGGEGELEREQGHGEEGLAETKGGADEAGEKQDKENVEGEGIHQALMRPSHGLEAVA